VDLLAGVHLFPVVHRAPRAAELYEQQQQQKTLVRNLE
jgi:hypothetical protein